MYRVNAVNRVTGERKTVLREVTREIAERFCDMWNWIYIEADESYWLVMQELWKENIMGHCIGYLDFQKSKTTPKRIFKKISGFAYDPQECGGYHGNL